MSGKKQKKRSANLAIAPGDFVLIGSPGTSMPSDWFVARVLWANAEEMLTEHQPPCGMPAVIRQVLHVANARAVGDCRAVTNFKEECRKAVAELSEVVRNAEQVLGEARDAVWAKLDEIGAYPPDRLSTEEPP